MCVLCREGAEGADRALPGAGGAADGVPAGRAPLPAGGDRGPGRPLRRVRGGPPAAVHCGQRGDAARRRGREHEAPGERASVLWSY